VGMGIDICGATVDFDSAMRRFEPSRPSQALQRLWWLSLILHSIVLREPIYADPHIRALFWVVPRIITAMAWATLRFDAAFARLNRCLQECAC
jgi:hypothetical protein